MAYLTFVSRLVTSLLDYCASLFCGQRVYLTSHTRLLDPTMLCISPPTPGCGILQVYNVVYLTSHTRLQDAHRCAMLYISPPTPGCVLPQCCASPLPRQAVGSHNAVRLHGHLLLGLSRSDCVVSTQVLLLGD